MIFFHRLPRRFTTAIAPLVMAALMTAAGKSPACLSGGFNHAADHHHIPL